MGGNKIVLQCCTHVPEIKKRKKIVCNRGRQRINMNHFLFRAGRLVRAVNPSMLATPPPPTEESGYDVCYLGPNGEDDPELLVYCKDLYEGQRGMVGSWYLTPERHIIEYISAVAISSTIIRALLPKLSRYPDDQVDNLNPPVFIKIPTCIFVSCQLIYKFCGYPGKVLFMFMPCNVLWTMWAFLCFWPNLSAQMMHILYQLIVPYSGLAIAAVATPDTSDLTMWGEVPFFFLMHCALIIYPIYFLSSGVITVLPIIGSNDNIVGNFLKWWALTCACFAFFYFGIATPLSVIYGLNVNYMLHPPPTPGDIISGPNFRLQSTLACAVAFFFFRFLATFAEVCANAFCRVTVYRSKKEA
mmetsp:Transcript_31593/g.66007  ORF Transcript_31593/g.66007 Transcript_31593/m.66007 type:complete len:357 (+) Transcript_31593:57-1127(+)